MQTLQIDGYKICLSSGNGKKNIHAKQYFAREAISLWSSFTTMSQLTKLLLMDWLVIEFFTDPSLFISRGITPQPRESKPLRAVFIPDRCADCGCFLQSHMTSYCHYLIPFSVVMFWLTDWWIPLPPVSLTLHSFLSFPLSYTLLYLFSISCIYAQSELLLQHKQFSQDSRTFTLPPPNTEICCVALETGKVH